jgi:hypothetical protein
VKYINIQIDGHGTPSDSQAAEFLKAVSDPSNGVVYVHCAGGRHRTGSMIALYRMTVDGWDIDQAYREMLAYDFYTSGGHQGFKSYVYDYYHRMTQTPPASPWRIPLLPTKPTCCGRQSEERDACEVGEAKRLPSKIGAWLSG